ncbi:fibronectin type III domain-containing protein [Brevundimonas abyssalis]|uniref:Purple acid phosphatase N-terminal domain-containing protein n=1 Tax=Brevundimonas abyssalis TAR-001 TaxID=1391729 RepID=A0A8E0TSS4_9CAUL|nr:fibronectin type III domain-containing protein [Brevundimonas abyssalis]GAD60564.1 hypothetical protein MBEBAB_2814 [Brevundimonas abyssalis TAR-001]
MDRPARLFVAFDSTWGETPFWLADLGFQRRADLDFVVDVEDPFHVWEKAVPAGEVNLGVPSLSGEMKPYVVFAAPAGGEGTVVITPLIPGADVQIAREDGAPYVDDNDWFNALPAELDGLPVLRSFESWEFVSRMVGFFRATDYPSSATPDHLQLTWQDDPRTGVTVQWRTDETVDESLLWLAPAGDDGAGRMLTSRADALTSRQIVNDPDIRLHRVRLDDLTPATDYEYAVSADNGQTWTQRRRFRTAADAGASPTPSSIWATPRTGWTNGAT